MSTQIAPYFFMLPIYPSPSFLDPISGENSPVFPVFSPVTMSDLNDDGMMDAVQRRLMFEDELSFSFSFGLFKEPISYFY